MTASPPPTLYHRWMGWHAPAMRRAAVVVVIGLIVAMLLLGFLPWGLALVAGWDAAALTFLMIVWPIILRADSPHAEQLATREDETRGSARALLVGASVASLLGVGFALSLAGQESGPQRLLLIGVAVLTVVLSWTVVNTIGMTYQVSDTTVRDPRIRRTVLSHAVLSYVFGVVIVGGAVNLVAGLVR
jgi:uncharacterized membrane protein